MAKMLGASHLWGEWACKWRASGCFGHPRDVQLVFKRRERRKEDRRWRVEECNAAG
jgi:hypothetical protein